MIKRVHAGTKRERVLRVFLERGERGLNCFEAVRLAHDYVLRTTVSEFSAEYGIGFEKQRETVPALGGSATADCVRYRLTPDGAQRALVVLPGAAA